MDCPALRYAAESVWHGSLFAPTPHGFGSLLMFEYIGVCAALQPQFDIISKPTPFACRKGVSPLTAIDTLIRCTTFAQSKWLAVPAISPSTMSHTLPRWVLRYAQTSCAGQEERTVAPHCRRSAARFTLTLCSGRCPCPLPAVRGQRSVNTLFNAPTPSPDVDVPLRCGCVRRAQSRKKV